MHARQRHAGMFIASGLLGLLLAGCAADVSKSITVSGDQLAKYETVSVADATAALGRRLDEARNANMPFLAPDYYRGANEILTEAQKSADKKPKSEVVSSIAKADVMLDKGTAMMAIVKDRLANELTMKDQLDNDNVAKVYPGEYEKAVSGLSSLIEKVELEKADNIDKDKVELIKTMQALDIKAIQYSALHDSELINEETESKDGEKQAPATLAEAMRVYQDAKDRIAQAPHDGAVVQRARTDALFAANHARYVNERVEALQLKIKELKDALEPIVQEEEKRLLDISTALSNQDLRDRPVDKQAEAIAKTAAEIVQGQQSSRQAMGAINDQSKQLELRLKAAEDQSKLQLAEKDEQLKALKEQIVRLEEQNKALAKPKSGKTKAAKVPKKNTAN